MELETKHDFGQAVVMCCSTLLFRNMSGIDNIFEEQLKLLQENPLYRPWLEEIEVGDYPAELKMVDEMFGLFKLRPWASGLVASTQEPGIKR